MIRTLLLTAAVLTGLAATTADSPRHPKSDDGRVAAVADLQGRALVRPAGRRRWSPVRPRSILLPGDQVRTELRGAHALELTLAGGGGVVLGPGTRVELTEPGKLHLLRGEVEITAGEARISVAGPGEFAREVSGTVLLRAAERTEELKAAPRWLEGYRASTTDEWMGSLLANVDGRDVALTLGYYKVDVVIRDQIAETTVEQSFVNNTDETLEGVFHFPLPADASISGFGMWIRGELVEADIVERQRARAIYEEILRRKKDPGLLEWEGGNVFKARVFPITPRADKRIRIRYTQVLPLEGDVVRYRHALRSELLRKHPLRELRVRVDLTSTLPIAEVSSPSHELSLQQAEHTATADFDAQDHSPTKDFELAVRIPRQAPLTVVTHERAEDGYFMLLLSPPGEAGGWQRELVPESDPLDLILIADTSGSMDADSRARQADFADSLLGMLGTEDRFRLMTCDVGVRWLTPQALPASEENRSRALEFLAGHASLGWSDLQAAFAAAAGAARAGTLVLYVGDGIVTAGDADGAALAGQVRRLGAAAPGASFHAVAASSSYDKIVLEALAAVGGGSLRTLQDGPAEVAYRLLNEAARPSLKELTVSFDGLRTARRYPEVLPNLPQGTQQIVLGRYLPTGEEQSGQVVVTGRLDGEEQRLSTDVRIAVGDPGNSFLPRLWARRHVDALLTEGRTPQIAEEIVSFSERFGIITPYTSFLVLENDADREEFGVQRRVQMRDGERFFAQARDKAATEALRHGMAKARSWRRQLRRQMLREIAGLGTDLHGWNVAVGEERLTEVTRYLGEVTNGSDDFFLGKSRQAGGRLGRPGDSGALESKAEGEALDMDGAGFLRDFDVQLAAEELGVAGDDKRMANFESGPSSPGPVAPARGRRALKKGMLSYGETLYRDLPTELRVAFGFPDLAPAAKPPTALPKPGWVVEILALVQSLDRRPALQAQPLGVQLRARHTGFHPVSQAERPGSSYRALWHDGSWTLAAEASTGAATVQWNVDGQRGVALAHLGIGRQREAKATDPVFPPFPLADRSVVDLLRQYRLWRARIAARDGARVTITLTSPRPAERELQLVIDTERGALVELSDLLRGKLQSRYEFSEFVEVAGTHWARRATRYDGDGRRTWTVAMEVIALAADAAGQQIAEVLKSRDGLLLLPAEGPKLEAAREAVHGGSAGFAQHFRLVAHYAARQRWDHAWRAWAGARAAAGDRRGAPWLEHALLVASRRGADLLAQTRSLAGSLAAKPDEHAFVLSELLQDRAASQLGTTESGELLGLLEPVYRAPGENVELRRRTFLRRAARGLEARDDHIFALALYRDLLDTPLSLQSALDYARLLTATGARPAAVDFLGQALDRPDTWSKAERNRLYQSLTDELWALRDLPALQTELGAWIAARPESSTAYLRHLSVLLFANRAEDADAWMQELLTGELRPHEDPAQHTMVQAALQFLLGSGWQFQVYEFPADRARRAKAWALRLARVERGGWPLLRALLLDWRFRRTDVHREIQDELRRDILAEGAVGSMTLERLAGYVDFLPWSRTGASNADSRRVAEALWERWGAAPDDHGIRTTGRLYLRLCDARKEDEIARRLLRRWVARTGTETVPEAARQLLERLARADWSETAQGEMLSLAPQVVDPLASFETRQQTIQGLGRFVADALVEMRRKARLDPVAELEKLPRAESRRKAADAKAESRRDVAAALAAASEGQPEWLRPWLGIEELCLQVRDTERGGPALTEVWESARKLLASVDAEDRQWPWRALRERCSLVMAYTAVSSKAPESLATRTLEVYRSREAKNEELDWRYQTFRLLLAMDRTEQLAETLRGWIVPARVDRPWRVALALLQAENGELADAAALLERLAADAELAPDEYRSLADWYLVLGDDVRRQKAREGRFAAMTIRELATAVRQETSRVGRRGAGVPDDLDPEVLLTLRALLARAPEPDDYLYQTRNLYRAVKDFRILECLADGVIGHSPEATFGFLGRIQRVLNEVHEEATLDSVFERLADVAARATSASDRRGIQLLRAMTERRAAQVEDGAAAHYPAMLAALSAAAEGGFAPSERVLMADLLDDLGAMPTQELKREVQRQLDLLLDACAVVSAERLKVARSRAQSLWKNGAREQAFDDLTAALGNRRRGSGGRLTQSGFAALNVLQGYAVKLARFSRMERILEQERDLQPVGPHRAELQNRLYLLYAQCLRKHGTVSLGSGGKLFAAAREGLEHSIARAPAYTISQWVRTFCELHQAAHESVASRETARLLRAFAEGPMQELLPKLPSSHPDVVRRVAQTLHEVDDTLAALRVLVQRTLDEPAWHARVGRDGWNRFHRLMSEYRSEIRDLDDVERGLETLVLRFLEANLRNRTDTGDEFYEHRNKRFWAAKRQAFHTVARRVIETEPDSAAVQLFAARYLWDGLRENDEAVATLNAADGRGALRTEGRWQLALWLQDLKRYAPSLPHLEQLIEAQPDQLNYRTAMIVGLHHTDQDARAAELAAGTEKRLRDQKRWAEGSQAQLAEACLEATLHDAAARYYEEAIGSRERSRRLGKGGDSVRARYYTGLSRALTGLKRVDDAVDAAGAAIVCCGERQNDRRKAIDALRRLFESIEDLDGYVTRLDARVAEQGLDSPVVRKALGDAFAKSARLDAALVQYLAARDLQADDPETIEKLVATYDGLRRPEDASIAMLSAIAVSRRNPELPAALAERFAGAGRKGEAERAWTQLVEIAPNEADGHRRLAQARKQQGRHGDALVQWQHVVRVRTDEPDGWLGVAEARIALDEHAAAREALEHVLGKKWDKRFGDVWARARGLVLRLQ